VNENTAWKQSFAEKPFLARLGIVLGILAGIAALVTLGYFMIDRCKPPVPDGAAEVATAEAQSSTEAAAAERPVPGTLADAERFVQLAISYGKSKKLTYVDPTEADTDPAFRLAFSRTVYQSADYQKDVEKSFEYAEQCWVRYSFTPSGSFTVECKTAHDKIDGDIYEVQLSFLGTYFKNP